jgi:iron-sulfur cluster repair protein YtfE (RIC family)
MPPGRPQATIAGRTRRRRAMEGHESQQRSAAYRRDHEELSAHVDELRFAAREVAQLSSEERELLVGRILRFLEGRLLPHAVAEEHTVYATVARLLSAEEATAPMYFDHAAIRERVTALAAADLDDVELLEELLYALHTLISLHFWKEEEIYFPLLDLEPSDTPSAGVLVGRDAR